ncbi:MAG: hypothetical protein AAF750_17575 [Planctomycetota bacterium]
MRQALCERGLGADDGEEAALKPGEEESLDMMIIRLIIAAVEHNTEADQAHGEKEKR